VPEAVQRCREERDERRLVDVAECRVLTADDEVQLVAEDGVAVREREVQCKRRRGQADGDRVPTVAAEAGRSHESSLWRRAARSSHAGPTAT